MANSEDMFFFMSNLSPASTGLPFVVWISVRGDSKLDVWVKVSLGLRANLDEMVTIGIRSHVRVIEGDMKPSDLELLTRWVDLNRDVIIRHWDDDIDTKGALDALKSI